MTDIIINTCYGGFSLSPAGCARVEELGYTPPRPTTQCREIPRDHPALLQAFREMGDALAGAFADLCLVTIPDDINWQIEEYDGKEWIAEEHRTWYA